MSELSMYWRMNTLNVLCNVILLQKKPPVCTNGFSKKIIVHAILKTKLDVMFFT